MVAHRSDGSGTTSNFTKYLAAAAPTTWTLGSGDTVNWAADTQAGNGNAGVAQIVKDTDGAIGYVDLADAEGAGLEHGVDQERGGRVRRTDARRGARRRSTGATVAADLTYNPLNAPGAKAYPITSPTWIIVYKNQKRRDARARPSSGCLTYVLDRRPGTREGRGLRAASAFARRSKDLTRSTRSKSARTCSRMANPIAPERTERRDP